MAQALAGSASAFEHIVRRHQRPVLSFLLRMTGDPALAEDLAQETFVKAFRSLAAFDATRRLSSWIFRIAHNTAVDALRKARPKTVPLVDDEHAAPQVADPVERRALGQALQRGLAALRPDQRSAIVLRYEDGLSYEDIGRILGVPEATARSHVYRGRRELARLLSATGWAPE